jgi:SAM-dependent methyltransferase
MSLASCRVCGGAETTLHSVSRRLPVYIWPLPAGREHELADAELFACGRCGHLQLQDFPEGFHARLYAHEAFNLEDEAQNRLRKERLEGALGAGFFAGRRVLDVGGGRNSFAAILEGAETWVSDFSVAPAVRASVSRALEGDFLKAELPEGSFDLLCLFHCLEHFDAPAAVVEKLRSILKPDGTVLVEVPNAADVIVRMPYYAVFHQHASLFTLEALDWLFARFGLGRRGLLRQDEVLLTAYTPGAVPAAPRPSDGRGHADALRRRLREIEDALRGLALDPDPACVGLYGGGGSAGLFLANFPWLQDRVGYCFDRDPRKRGRFLPGGKVRIHAPEDMDALRPRQILFLSSSLCREVGSGRSFEAVDLEAAAVRAAPGRGVPA